ncbi:MAG: hypothetical protein WDO19_09525 [Bacteroidota bacterium]
MRVTPVIGNLVIHTMLNVREQEITKSRNSKTLFYVLLIASLATSLLISIISYPQENKGFVFGEIMLIVKYKF